MFSQNMMWSIGLVMLAAVFTVLEFLIPSAGLLGIGAAMAAIAALVLAYTESTAAGLTMTGVLVLATPVLLVTAIRVWPYTPIGRRILNLPPLDAGEEKADGGKGGDLGRGVGGTERRRAKGIWEPENPFEKLIGKVGVAKTNMLPGGQIEIEGRKYDAVAQGAAVDIGNFIEVTNVDAGKIRVRVTNRRPALDTQLIQSIGTDRSAEGEVSEEGLLDGRTLDDFDLEDLGDPLR